MTDFNNDFEEEEPEEDDPIERHVHSVPTSYPCLKRILSAAEEIDLCSRAQNGDERAREAMMEANLRLVMAIARRYNCRSMTYEDIVQEGTMGLLEAIKKFDVTRGHRFSTYATYWIRQAIVRAIEKQDRMIRLPTYGCNAERKVRLSAERLSESLGRSPTPEEVSKDCGLSKRTVQALVFFAQEPLSLDAMIGVDQDTPSVDFVEDENAVNPELMVLRRAGIESLDELLGILKPRERAVIECRFGLRDGRIWTLKECAADFSISREGVRHTEVRSIKKLQAAAFARLGPNPDLVLFGDLLSA